MAYCKIHILIAVLGFVKIVSSQFNSPPIITNSAGYIQFPENTEIGTVLHLLNATDEDGDVISFKASTQDTKDTVNVEESKPIGSQEYGSNVTLKKALDLDNKPSRVYLFFDASDGQNKVPIKLTLIISDVNDNPPSLIRLPYRTYVKEDFPIGQSLYQFHAKDPDMGKGRSILYNMEPNREADKDDYLATFNLDEAKGEVSLKKKLDYETRSFYHFKVSAKDEGNPPCPGPGCLCKGDDYCNGTVVDFFITVEDVEDTPPIFNRLSYRGTVHEDSPINTTILTIEAFDGDRAVPDPSPIQYNIPDETVPFFVNSNGEMKVARNLDADDDTLRAKGGLYVFNVTATETTTNDNASALVFITVEDSNDNPPMFNARQFTGNVLENTPIGVPLSMNLAIEVKDRDQGVNSRFKIYVKKMDGDEPEMNFDTIPSQNQILQGSSSITVTVNNSSLLDFETTKTFSFKLVAQEVVGADNKNITDGTKRDEALVKINVVDTNDNSPVFVEQQGTTYNVSEDVETGHVIHTFKANDLDSGDFGRVEYYMEDDSTFKIDSGGNLSTAVTLDREKQSSYFAVITATDNPDASVSQQRTQLRVTIQITDVNDETPTWKQLSDTYRVPETEIAGTTLGVLRATDADIGKNGELVYSVLPNTNGSSFFNVNTTQANEAELYISQSLRGHPGTYTVNVEAKDKGDKPKDKILPIKVYVVDINLKPPVFIKPNASNCNETVGEIPEIKVYEEQQPGTVLYQFKAQDEGTGHNGDVYYKLLNNNDFDFFSVNQTTGDLMSDKRLDREFRTTYTIQVKATDNGFPVSLSTTLTMRIKLKDINDNGPKFKDADKPQIMNVIEEKENASIGIVKNATDADLSDDICYYLCDDQSVSLHLDKESRNLSLVGSVDREKMDQFDVKVYASDCCDNSSTNCSVMNESMLRIQVKVEDINDNRPQFIWKEYSRSIIFDEQVDTEVINLKDKVTDKDAPPYNNKFLLKSCLDKKGSSCKPEPFNVSATGSIRTKSLFQADLVEHFVLVVEVYEEESKKDSAEVKIYIVSNEQRVRLVFPNTPSEVEGFIDELTKKLSGILNLKITIGAIKTHTKSDNTRDNSKTDAFIYASNKGSETIMLATDLQNALDFSSGSRKLLFTYGVQKAQGLSTEKDEDGDEMLRRLFIILVTVMSILVIALILVLINIIRMYRRRLKAATTMAYVSPKEQEMYEHPGTNKYYAAENPLFGKEIKAPELEEDRNSTNSLDVNAVDQKSPSKTAYDNIDPEEEQEVVLQIMDSSLSTPQHNGYSNQNARLNKVLEEYDNSVNGSGKTKPPPPPPVPYMNGVGHKNNSMPQTNGHGIPGLGQDVLEAVTRFSDDGSRRKTIQEISTNHGNLEYTEI